ncbi:Nitroreductase-like protein [Mrakia frigida]|uniref:Nitroreductase-like protein n=1 Tax=Mrakia frigida TaxID=29902 RepID=UPI003FCC00BB
MAFSPNYIFLLAFLTIFIGYIKTNNSTSLMSPTSACFLAALSVRRSVYNLSNVLPVGVSQASIQASVEQAVKLSPSPFNIQSARVVILWGTESDRLWDIVWGKVNAVSSFADEEARAASESKVKHFARGAGTILFFEDQADIDKISLGFPAFAPIFPTLSEQSSGILTSNIWTLLSVEGVGANLQHQSVDLIEADVLKTWDLPLSWELKAQLPFGGIAAPPSEPKKTFEGRTRYFGGEVVTESAKL